MMETNNYLQSSNVWHCITCHQEILDEVQHSCSGGSTATFCGRCNPTIGIKCNKCKEEFYIVLEEKY